MYYLEDAYGMTLSGRERERVKETTAKRDTNTKERRAHSRTRDLSLSLIVIEECN